MDSLILNLFVSAMNFSIKEWLFSWNKSYIFRKGHWNTKNFSFLLFLLLIIWVEKNVYNKCRHFQLLTNSPLKKISVLWNTDVQISDTHLIKMLDLFQMPHNSYISLTTSCSCYYLINLLYFIQSHWDSVNSGPICTVSVVILSHYILYNYMFPTRE